MHNPKQTLSKNRRIRAKQLRKKYPIGLKNYGYSKHRDLLELIKKAKLLFKN